MLSQTPDSRWSPTVTARNSDQPVELVRGVTAPFDTPEEALDAIAKETNDYLASRTGVEIDGISHQLMPVTGHRTGPPGILGTRRSQSVQQYIATIVVAVRYEQCGSSQP